MEHAADVSFFAPDVAFDEARTYLPALLEKRGVSGAPALATLDALETVVQPIDEELYQGRQEAALARIGERDAETGQPWRARCCSVAPCGPKTPTSSAQAWRIGQRVV
jgi:hypothetical protein